MKKLVHDARERSSVPLVVAIVGLIAAAGSFAIRDEKLGATLLGSGLITAGWRIVYWLASPGRDSQRE